MYFNGPTTKWWSLAYEVYEVETVYYIGIIRNRNQLMFRNLITYYRDFQKGLEKFFKLAMS